MRDNGRDTIASPSEIDVQREAEVLAVLDQVEADLLDHFTVRPITAERGIRALRAFLPAEHRTVADPARKPYPRAAE